MEMAPWEVWIRSTELHAFVQHYEPRLWPLMQTLHLLGFTLLIGTVGFFDLRALGVAKGIPLRAIHRLVPWGIAGYIGNLLLGIVFFSGHPEQYFYNNAFRLKLVFMAVAAPTSSPSTAPARSRTSRRCRRGRARPCASSSVPARRCVHGSPSWCAGA
jgi:hypothetical protein